MSEQMQAGLELDVELGRRLFKLEVDWEGEEDRHPLHRHGKVGWCELPKYSTDWNSMRLVVEEMQRRGWATEMNINLNNYVVMRRIIGNTDTEFCSSGDLPHLVCLAALKALEADTHE